MNTIKTLLATTFAATITLAAAPAMAADYLPVGPQTNVALSTVTGGGWSLCYSASMGSAIGNSAAAAISNCTGDRLMLAGRVTGSDTLLALAQAPRADVLFDTGAANNGVFHLANGTNWFNADNWSWGFVGAGQSLTKYQCGIGPANGSMCIHTVNGAGGYSINGMYTSTGYDKLVFQFVSGAVPEPATWGMMILGFGVVGAAMRRRAKVSRVAFAI
ncbi:PEPxxWA-CTERM sorting domain-containing protein [Sphingomonas sp. Leaf357]|uniref:PEPxxWA-CTERM sorting domain-containing protein n=1 Tax=Sphingomonas sp. Leaf357 TaxID=1736350 RepID=UPI001F337379|nr:PEPxxWA-CTERM sorting domain-containing protein [Sphingomonas sp. Leaf357]